MTFEEISSEFYQENRNNLCQFMPKSHKQGIFDNNKALRHKLFVKKVLNDAHNETKLV